MKTKIKKKIIRRSRKRVTPANMWDSWASIPVRAVSTSDSLESNSGL